MSRRTNRAIKRALKAGGLYDTRGFYKNVREFFKSDNNLNINDEKKLIDNDNYELSPKTKKLLPWITIFLIMLGIILLNIGNIKKYYYKNKGTKILKSEINEILEEYGFKDYEVNYTENNEDTKITCRYDIDIYYNDFDKIDNQTKYEMFEELEYHQIDESPWCYIKNASVYVGKDKYEKKLLSIYKNDEEIYDTFKEKKSEKEDKSSYKAQTDDNWQNYKSVTKNASGCFPAMPDYVCHKEKNPVTGEIQKICRCMKTYD